MQYCDFSSLRLLDYMCVCVSSALAMLQCLLKYKSIIWSEMSLACIYCIKFDSHLSPRVVFWCSKCTLLEVDTRVTFSDHALLSAFLFVYIREFAFLVYLRAPLELSQLGSRSCVIVLLYIAICLIKNQIIFNNTKCFNLWRTFPSALDICATPKHQQATS